jgi:hypothetical protein
MKAHGTEDWFAGGFLEEHHAEEGRRGYEKRFTPQGKLAQKQFLSTASINKNIRSTVATHITI